MSEPNSVFYPVYLAPDLSGHISKDNAYEFMDNLALKLSVLTPDLLPDGQVWVGSNTGIATPVAISGDATIDNTGAVIVASVGGADAANVGFCANATSDIQAQIDGISGSFEVTGDVNISNAVSTISDAGLISIFSAVSGDAENCNVSIGDTGLFSISDIGGASPATIGYCANVTSDIQDQIDNIVPAPSTGIYLEWEAGGSTTITGSFTDLDGVINTTVEFSSAAYYAFTAVCRNWYSSANTGILQLAVLVDDAVVATSQEANFTIDGNGPRDKNLVFTAISSASIDAGEHEVRLQLKLVSGTAPNGWDATVNYSLIGVPVTGAVA